MAYDRYRTALAAVLAGIVVLCMQAAPARALDMDGVIAYPVPCNPVKLPLTIQDKKLTAVSSVKLEIFDINGDAVYRKGYSIMGAFDRIYWGGRNNSGRMVKPGLYIIKLTAESNTGDYGTRILRILVDY